MNKTLALILFFTVVLTSSAQSQFTHGFELSRNYSWHNQTYDYEIHSPEWGYGLGYKFAWQFNQKWELSITPSAKLHYVTTKYIDSTHPQYVDTDKAPTYFTSIPLCIGYSLVKNLRIASGYQYSWTWDELSEANPKDHAALMGLSYDFGFVRPQITYQQSLNTMERKSIIGAYAADGTPIGEQETTHKYSRMYAINLSLFIPLNRQNKKQ